MNKKKLACLAVTGLFALSLPLLAGAAEEPVFSDSSGSAITGSLFVKGLTGDKWVQCGQDETRSGVSYRTGDQSEAVVSLGGDVQVRMAPGTLLNVERSSSSNVALKLQSGKIFASVPEAGTTVVSVTSPTGTVHSSSGNFIVTADQKHAQTQVVDGAVNVNGKRATSPNVIGAKSVAGVSLPAGFVAFTGEVAADIDLDGPDTRTRKAQNVNTPPQNAGEDVPPRLAPEESPTPEYTETPVASPTFSETPLPPSPDVSPPPDENPPPPEEGGPGDEAWAIPLALLATGGIIYALIPASP